MGCKALLVYPEMPPTYWSMRYALPFLGKKAVFPPLGLLTVAALLPDDWELRLVDLNVEALEPEAVAAADLVLVSAMLVQKPSFERVLALCRALHTPVVAGGPYPTHCHGQIEGVSHFVLNEAEQTLPPFLADLAAGRAGPLYADTEKPDMSRSPAPRFDLVDRRLYVEMGIQFSRGCPHACEFCDITSLFGRRPRAKEPAQVLHEMDLLYGAGWRGSLFVVDDNFIGNRARVRRLLPELTAWQRQRGYPFGLYTEASLDLAGDEPLVDAMVEAGFNMVFVGIETPDDATLEAIGKGQNRNRDLLASVHALQRKGLEVSGGFIVGFDSDTEDIFERQRAFIQEAAIPTAMVGLLSALPGTPLCARLEAEGRLLGEGSGGNNTHDLELNFVPRMAPGTLKEGYRRLLVELYRPRRYFARCLRLIRLLRGPQAPARPVRWVELRAFVHSLFRQGLSRYAWAYWNFLLRGLLARPRLAAETVGMAVKGHHFILMTRRLVELERYRARLEQLAAELAARSSEGATEWRARRDRALARAAALYEHLHGEIRSGGRGALSAFRHTVEGLEARRG